MFCRDSATPVKSSVVPSLLLSAVLLLATDPVRGQGSDVGYRSLFFGTTPSPTPTGEKPESKIWWNDGAWWGSLWNEADSKYHLFRLDMLSQSWTDTGTALDDRHNSKADALWHEAGQKLYLASHVFSTNAAPQVSTTQWGRLYRYSYNTSTDSYSLDAGFPALVTRGNAEAMTVARDSTGQLWVTWVESGKVMMNRSLSSDLEWGEPTVLPVSAEAASVTTDDLAAIIAFGGDKVGVMWSNQTTSRFYFSVHQDGAADLDWQMEEVIFPDANCSGFCADDQLNLKADAVGRVYAVVKTSLTGLDSPLVMVVARDLAGAWSSHVFGRVRDHHTRPVMLLDEENSDLYVFATTPEAGGSIYYKKASLSDMSFPVGVGLPFIQSSLDLNINNATTTKQNVNSTTGIVVLASDQNTHYYVHNAMAILVRPVIAAFNPTMGPPETAVAIQGSAFTGATSVTFNGVEATFSVTSDTEIAASLPSGATSGRIRVTTPGGTGTSDSDFQVTTFTGPSTPVEFGYLDFGFGASTSSTPTGEKPESKIWWNDGIWWGSLWSEADMKYHIFRFDWSSQSWSDTGTPLDDRHSSRADALWDEAQEKLFLVSHIFSTNATPEESPANWGRLYRYSYDTGSTSYSLDAGFPVSISRGNAEAMTLARDSTGQLWVTWVESGKVMVNRSMTSDLDWGEPFVLPVSAEAASVSTDDISSIIAFAGDQVGVMWSNQAVSRFYFSAHRDGDEDTSWQAEEVVLPDVNCSGPCADDHLHLMADSTDRVYAALKTNLTDVVPSDPAAPLVLLAVRDPVGAWKTHIFGRIQDNHTRPILLLDEENSDLYIFATRPQEGGSIYYKKTSLGNISFPEGDGTPFIDSSSQPRTNNATSTKQALDSDTGLLVLASDQVTRSYLHNSLDLPVAGGAPPQIASFSPASGTMLITVTVLGSGFTGATSVTFNGQPATFTVIADARIDAVVPTTATSGKISVTTSVGTAISVTDFTVIPLPDPVISSFSPTSGTVGTAVTILGSSFTFATSVTFNGTPAAFTRVSDTLIDATVPSGATTGRIRVTNPVGTATSGSNFTVIVPRITSFTPTSGQPGTAVTVLGSLFTGATSVTFNGAPATFTPISDTQIDTVVPVTATSGRIRVITPLGTATSSGDFKVLPPTITSFSPTSGPVGTVVTFLGSGFSSVTSVRFDKTPASFTLVSDTRIDAVVPIGATSGKIHLVAPAGHAHADFIVILPRITSFTPASGQPGTAVTVLGSLFTGATSVTFDGTPATFTVVSDTRIDTVVPDTATTGKIRVDTPLGMATSSEFRVLPPRIDSFSPASGPVGTTVTILGSAFNATTKVVFNKTSATFTVVSSTQIDAVVPIGATTGKISVTIPAGKATSSQDFRVTP